MRLNRQIVREFTFAQSRAWGCYCIWLAYSVQDLYTVTGFLGFLIFLVATEYVFWIMKGMFLTVRKG